MKKFLFIILAAVVGGLAALGGAQILGLNEQVKYVEVQPQPTTNYANFAEPSTTVNVNPAPSAGFATAAEKALPAVVHIKASKQAGGGGSRGGFEVAVPISDAEPQTVMDSQSSDAA